MKRKQYKNTVRVLCSKDKSTIHLNKNFEPFILALLISGISVKRASKPIFVIGFMIRLLFLSCFTLTFANTVICMIGDTRSFYLFTLFTKIIIFFCWCSAFRKTGDISELLRILKILQKECKGKSLRIVTWAGRISVVIFLALIWAPSVKAFASVGGHGINARTCHEFWMDLHGLRKEVYYFVLTMARQFTNWTVPFSLTLFYSLFCFELSNKIRLFHKSSIDNPIPNSNLSDFYDATVAAILKLEEALSLSMLLVLFTNFSEMFRIFTLILFIDPKRMNSNSISHSQIYFAQTAILFLVLIFAADSLQIHFNVLRRKLLLSPYIFSGESEQTRFRKRLIMVEDQEYVKLTAWGVFEIKRTLILSAIASLITYGVLIQQLKK